MKHLCAALAIILALAGAARAQTKVTIGYGPGSAWAGAWIAQDDGIFKKNGLDVTFSFVSGGQLQAAALIANSVQIVGNNPIQVLLADEAGADIVVIAGADGQTKQNPYSGVALNTSRIKTLADFAGKKVAVPGLQSLMHIAFQMWLKDKGVDPAKVTYIETPMQNMPDQLAAGQIDAAVSSPPFLAVAGSKPDAKVIHFTAELPQPDFVDAFYVSTRDWDDANPKALAAFRASIREATAMIIKNPAIVPPELVKYLKMKPAEAAKTTLPNFFSDVTPAMMQFWLDATREFGVTKGTLKVSDVLAK